jgi:hypothetical protein
MFGPLFLSGFAYLWKVSHGYGEGESFGAQFEPAVSQIVCDLCGGTGLLVYDAQAHSECI